MKKTNDLEEYYFLKLEEGRRRGLTDPLFFIENFLYIEDKDVDGSVIPFDLWPDQRMVVDEIKDNNRVIILKARQLGLSWLALAFAFHTIYYNPGKTVSTISKKEEDAAELVRRVKFFLRHLPSSFALEKGHAPEDYHRPIYEAGSLKITIYHKDPKTKKNLEPSIFRGHTSSPDAARSFTDNIIILDEWAFHPFAERIWEAAYPTINRPGGGGKVIGLSTGRLGTFFEQMWTRAEAEESTFKPIFLSWKSHPLRDREWYEKTRQDLPGNFRAEYPSTPEEAFSVGEGAFFHSWDPDIHMQFDRDWYPPSSWRIVGAYDGGYNRAYFAWYAISPDGWVVKYREYYPARNIDPNQAVTIKSMSKDEEGVPEYFSYIVADTSCWAKNKDTGKSTAEIFSDFGLHMRQADKDRVMGWRRLFQMMRPFYQKPEDEENGLLPIANLMMTKSCAVSRRIYPGIRTHDHNPDDIAPGQEDHVCDADRYFAMSRPVPLPSKEERRRIEKAQKKHRKPRSSITGY